MNQERSPLLVTKADCLRNERNWKGKSWGLAWGLCALPPSSLPARFACVLPCHVCVLGWLVNGWLPNSSWSSCRPDVVRDGNRWNCGGSTSGVLVVQCQIVLHCMSCLRLYCMFVSCAEGWEEWDEMWGGGCGGCGGCEWL